MDKSKTVTFIGHDETYGQEHASAVSEAVETLIKNGADTFLCGGMGGWDWLCAGCVYKLKKKYPHIQSFVVIPYLTFNILNSEYFDDSLYPDLERYHFKQAIVERNKYLLANSSYAICHVTHSWGGAAATYKRAQKQKLIVIDI